MKKKHIIWGCSGIGCNTIMKRTVYCIIVVIGLISCNTSKKDVEGGREKETYAIDANMGDTVVVHDTIVVKDVKYYDGRWLRKKFETCEWKQYESYDYGFVVCYPAFMEKDLNRTSENSVFVEYKDVRLMAKAYREDIDMSLEQKYQELNKSANTKSIGENYFMIAGLMGDDGCYFEKDIKADGYWFYIRAEFPQPFTPYIDTLLQYVKNYDLK